MASLDWLTPEKVSAFLGKFGALAFLGLGLLSLYQGLTGPQTNVYFGFDAFVWVGVGWILSGLYFWFSQYFLKNATEN